MKSSFLTTSELVDELEQIETDLLTRGYSPQEAADVSNDCLRQLLLGCDVIGGDGDSASSSSYLHG